MANNAVARRSLPFARPAEALQYVVLPIGEGSAVMANGRPLRIMLFVIVLLVTLGLATVLVFFSLHVGSAYGYVQLKELEVTAPTVVAAILGITGLVGAIVAFDRNLLEARAVRARFAFNLNQAFFESSEERQFYYLLEHDGSEHGEFNFDPIHFPKSENERHLDGILYRLSLVGALLSKGILELGDIQFVRHITKTVLSNKGVLEYLAWLKQQEPNHASFVDAIYLYRMTQGRDDVFALLKRYIG